METQKPLTDRFDKNRSREFVGEIKAMINTDQSESIRQVVHEDI